jgi:hypothetical protein
MKYKNRAVSTRWGLGMIDVWSLTPARREAVNREFNP